MAAPIYQVNPLMGANLIIVVFAVVVIGGMGSILGAILTGFGLGVVEGLTKVFYPEASNTVIFVIMVIVLLIKPAGPVRQGALTMATAPAAPPRSAPCPGATRSSARPRSWRRLLAVAPFVGVYPVFLMKALCFALFACAFNLLIGFGGLLSFGHAMFLGTAGYVCAHAAKEWGWPPELAILAGTLAAAVLGIVAGALAIRRQGIYFAMITLALAQMIFFFYLQAPFTHGEDGIQAVPRGKLFGVLDLSNTLVMYYVVLVIFLAAFLLIYRIVHSPFGQVLKAIRENEPRAISLGYDAERYKLLAFVLSAALSGLAGATKAIVFQLASLTDVHWTMSGEVVLMTLLGGMGTIFGPVVGAFAIIGLESYLAGFGQWVTVITGVHLRRLRARVPARHRRRDSARGGRRREGLSARRWRRRCAAARRRRCRRRTLTRRGQLPRRPAARRLRAARRRAGRCASSARSPRQAHRQLPVLVERRRAHRAAAVRRRRALGHARAVVRAGAQAGGEPQRKLEAAYAQRHAWPDIKRSWYPDGRLRAEFRYERRRARRSARVQPKPASRCPTPRPRAGRARPRAPTTQFFASLDAIVRAHPAALRAGVRPRSRRASRRCAAARTECGRTAEVRSAAALTHCGN